MEEWDLEGMEEWDLEERATGGGPVIQEPVDTGNPHLARGPTNYTKSR